MGLGAEWHGLTLALTSGYMTRRVVVVDPQPMRWVWTDKVGFFKNNNNNNLFWREWTLFCLFLNVYVCECRRIVKAFRMAVGLNQLPIVVQSSRATIKTLVRSHFIVMVKIVSFVNVALRLFSTRRRVLTRTHRVWLVGCCQGQASKRTLSLSQAKRLGTRQWCTLATASLY